MTARRPRQRLEPRKRPLQSRSAQTVHAILEAAARILERHGFAGYTTNAVAERAGVSIGSLYQYFPGKDALTVALIERETSVLLAEIAEACLESGFAAGTRRMISAAVAHQMRRPELARLLDFEERRLPIATRNGRIADTIHTAFCDLMRRPDAPRVDDPAVAARDVLAMVKGIIDAAGERGESDHAALDRRVRRAVCGYLRTAQAPRPGCGKACFCGAPG